MLSTRIIRGITLSSVMSLGMTIAHILGGGNHELNFIGPFVFIFSAIFFTFLSPKKLEGPVLASYILGFQIMGHLSFSSSVSDSRMSTSHIVAAFLTYFLALHFQKIFDSLLEFFRSVVCVYRQIILSPASKSLIFFAIVEKTVSPHFSQVKNRAPPHCAAV